MAFLSTKNDNENYIVATLTELGGERLFADRGNQSIVDQDSFMPKYFSFHDGEINYMLYNRDQINAGFDVASLTADDNFNDIKDIILLEPVQTSRTLSRFGKLFGVKDLVANIFIKQRRIDSSGGPQSPGSGGIDIVDQDRSIAVDQLKSITDYGYSITPDFVVESRVQLESRIFNGIWISPKDDDLTLIQSIKDYNSSAVHIEVDGYYSTLGGHRLANNFETIQLNVLFLSTNESVSFSMTDNKFDFGIKKFILGLGFDENSSQKIFEKYIGIYQFSVEFRSGNVVELLPKKTIKIIRKEPLPEGNKPLIEDTSQLITSSYGGVAKIIDTNQSFFTQDAIDKLRDKLSTIGTFVAQSNTEKVTKINMTETIQSSFNSQLSIVTSNTKLKKHLMTYYNKALVSIQSPLNLVVIFPRSNNIDLILRNWVTREEISILKASLKKTAKFGHDAEYSIPFAGKRINLKVHFQISIYDGLKYYVDITNLLASFAPELQLTENFGLGMNDNLSGTQKRVFTSGKIDDYQLSIIYPSYATSMNRRSLQVVGVSTSDIAYGTFEIVDKQGSVIMTNGLETIPTDYNPLVFLGSK